MNLVVVKKKVSYSAREDGIDAYHAELFHGTLLNKRIADNNLGDVLTIRLQLAKNVYDCRFIFQPQRNLVLPESAKERLSGVPNIDFFQVTFEKLFFAPYSKGDFSIGPESYYDLEKWLGSFKHEERLRHEIEDFHELILPAHSRLLKEFAEAPIVEFNLVSWRTAKLNLSVAMLSKFPAIWTPEGIVFRADIFERIEEFFSWDYFHKGQFTVSE